ncbi:MAG: OB-fold nucleic acid binding domain-containing protein, partial [Candidatus Neomarinimicrobiota bacterium]
MQSVLVKDVQSYNGQEVSLRGWVYNLRSSGKIWFLLLRDGTGLIQGIVSRNDVTEEVFNQKDNLTQESAIRI